MTDPNRINQIARHLHDAHAARQRFENLSGDMALSSIDEAYEAFGDSGDPLFNNGEASEITKSALAFCQVFEREIGATSAFIMALEQAGLLYVDLPSFDRLGGRKLTVKGVRAIDRASFDALPDATFIEWRQKGWLPAVYAHLNSMANWDLIGA